MMKRFSQDQIEALLDKFMDGQTTLEEEAQLAEYFSSDDVPEQWQDYRAMFNYFDRGMTRQDVPPTGSRRIWWWTGAAAAAVAAIVIGITVWLNKPSTPAMPPTPAITEHQADTPAAVIPVVETEPQMLASNAPARPVAASRPAAAPRLDSNDSPKQENGRQQGELDESKHSALTIDRTAMGHNASQNQEGGSVIQVGGYFYNRDSGYTTSATPKINGSKFRMMRVGIDTKKLDKFIEQVQADMEKKYRGDVKKNQFSTKPIQAKITQRVSGIVLDEKAEPVIGATVRVKGKNVGTCTDIDGRFTLQATTGQTLEVSYAGYTTQDIVVNGNELVVIMHDELLGQKNKELNDLFLRVKPQEQVNKKSSKEWMQQLLFCLDRLQKNDDDRHIYLSKLYNLCKDTDGLDQTDLKTAAQQLSSVYEQLKAKSRLKENELVFLKNMVDLLESKIKRRFSSNYP